VLGALASTFLAPLLTFGYHEGLERVDAPSVVALEAAHAAIEGRGINPHTEVDLLLVIDYDEPSWSRRMVIYERGQCPVQQCLVAHGSGNADSTKQYATRFSNVPGSSMMSLGLFVVAGDRPSGKFGRSIEIDGLVQGVNDRARARLVVIHPAHYVSYSSILENLVEEMNPRLGQSRGCPALTQADFNQLLARIRDARHAGGFVFLYAHRSPEPEPVTVMDADDFPLPEVRTKKLPPLDLDALTIPAWP